MKSTSTFILTLTFVKIFSQNIHHQMISSQAKTRISNSGLIVKQTVGQVSISGSYSGNFIVQQGFQQSFWDGYLSGSNPILVSASPNPFTDQVQFDFSDLKNEKISFQIFNSTGTCVYLKEFSMTKDQSIRLSLGNLSIGMYLIKIAASDFNHFCKIIKK